MYPLEAAHEASRCPVAGWLRWLHVDMAGPCSQRGSMCAPPRGAHKMRQAAAQAHQRHGHGEPRRQKTKQGCTHSLSGCTGLGDPQPRHSLLNPPDRVARTASVAALVLATARPRTKGSGCAPACLILRTELHAQPQWPHWSWRPPGRAPAAGDVAPMNERAFLQQRPALATQRAAALQFRPWRPERATSPAPTPEPLD